VLDDSNVDNQMKFWSFFWKEQDHLKYSDYHLSGALILVQVLHQDYQIDI